MRISEPMEILMGQRALTALLLLTAIHLQVILAEPIPRPPFIYASRERRSPLHWENRCRSSENPWDLGMPTPILKHLDKTGTLRKGRALIIGCLRGHDVEAIASSKRFVVGLDNSKYCIKLAKELHSSSPNAENFKFVKANLFTYRPRHRFDLIFDYTFFASISYENMRKFWAKKISKLLKSDGELITLIWSDWEFHTHYDAPYFVTKEDYKEVLIPLGFVNVSVWFNQLSPESRKRHEMLARWKRIPAPKPQ